MTERPEARSTVSPGEGRSAPHVADGAPRPGDRRPFRSPPTSAIVARVRPVLLRISALLAMSATLSLSAPAWAQAPSKQPAPAKKGAPAKPPPPAPPAPPPAPAPPAGKKPPPAPAPVEEDTNKMLEEAQKAARSGKWDEARTILQRAYKLRPTWKMAAELGRAEVGAGKFKDGAEHLTIALRDKPDDLPEAEQKPISEALAQATAQIGVLRVNVRQPGAEIVVAGKVVGTAPLPGPVFVDPGKVLIEARLEGFFGLKSTKNIAAGSEETVDFVLHRDSSPGARELPPAAGDRLLKGRNLIVFASGVSVAGAGVVLGGVFAILSSIKASKSHDLEQPTATCGVTCVQQFDDLQKQKVTFAGASMWSFIGAGAVALGTGTYMVVQLFTKPQQEVKAQIVVRPDQVGGAFTLQW